MKKRKKLIARVAIVIALLFVSLGGAGWYMLDYSLKPDETIRLKNDSTFSYMYAEYPFLESWVDSLNRVSALKDTFLINQEGKKLHAYYVAASESTQRTAVIVHGYTDNAIRMFMIAYLYNHDLGFNVLLPDLQYHGESEGEAIRMGWKDRLDVMEWMQLANDLFGGNTRMVVHGISMGAATTMMVSGEKQPEYVKCFVEDCGYTSVWEQFSKELDEQFGLPEFPLLYVADFLCQIRYGWGFKEASPLKQVAKCELPMLFIHGDQDKFVPTWMVYPLYEAKPGSKQLWIAPGSEHAFSYRDHRDAYTAQVSDFVNRYVH